MAEKLYYGGTILTMEENIYTKLSSLTMEKSGCRGHWRNLKQEAR